jgi:hypothetical protein
MFCNQCGSQVRPGDGVCPKCGKAANWPATGLAQSRLERHLHTLAIFWMVVGALFLIPSIVLMVMGSVVHITLPGAEEFVRTLGPVMLYLLGSSLLILAAGGICVGWGLMQHRPWARITALILGVLSLFHPPLGTALGIYTLWVLLGDDGEVQYRSMARAA